MNQQIVDYLQQNKESHTQESLVTQLRTAGHNDADINTAVQAVYGGDTPVPPSGNVNNVQGQSEKKMSGCAIAAIIVGVIFGVLVIVLIIGSIIISSSLNSARDKAKDASAKSTISSTVPAAILCMDAGYNLTNPVPGNAICRGSEGMWPDFGMTGEWGVMMDGNVSDGTFEYTASYGESGTAICTQMGCVFPN